MEADSKKQEIKSLKQKLLNIVNSQNYYLSNDNLSDFIIQQLGLYYSVLVEQKKKVSKNIFFKYFQNKTKIQNDVTLKFTQILSENKIKNKILEVQQITTDILDKIFQEIVVYLKNQNLDLNVLEKIIEEIKKDLDECFRQGITFNEEQIINNIFLIQSDKTVYENVYLCLVNEYETQVQNNKQREAQKIYEKIDHIVRQINAKLKEFLKKIQKYLKRLKKYSYFYNIQVKNIQNETKNDNNILNSFFQSLEDSNSLILTQQKVKENILEIQQSEFQQIYSQGFQQRAYFNSQECVVFGPKMTQSLHQNNNSLNQKQLIVWIDNKINEVNYQKRLEELKKIFGWLDVQGFQNYEQFESYLDNKLQQQYEWNLKMNQSLKQKKFRASITLQNMQNDDNLTKSVIIQQEVYENFQKESTKNLHLSFFLIASGSVIQEKYHQFPNFIQSIMVYTEIENDLDKFSNKQKVSLTTQKFDLIKSNIQDILSYKKESIVYNYDINKLKECDFDLIYYMSDKYCAQSIEQKTEEEIKEMLANLLMYLPIKYDAGILQKLQQKIYEGYTNVNEVIKLYTTSYYRFINIIMTKLNNQVLENSKYLITSLRYAIQVYKDGCSNKFKEKDFKLYRGISTDIQKFQQDFPIKTTFVTFNFSSSSEQRSVAVDFVNNSKNKQDKGMIFEISFPLKDDEDFEECRPKKIPNKNNNNNEAEFLFNCFSIFHVKNYRDEGNLTCVELDFQNNLLAGPLVS